MDTMEFLRELSDENLETLPYMIKAEQQRRNDKKRDEAIINHVCKTYEEMNRCPLCSIP